MQIENPKILSIHEMRAQRDKLVAEGKKLVFTNGCFDILHRGHVSYLTFARNQGDALVVAVNTDASVSTPSTSQRNKRMRLSAVSRVAGWRPRGAGSRRPGRIVRLSVPERGISLNRRIDFQQALQQSGHIGQRNHVWPVA